MENWAFLAGATIISMSTLVLSALGLRSRASVDSVQTLNTLVTQLRTEVAECHKEREVLSHEVEGLKDDISKLMRKLLLEEK